MKHLLHLFRYKNVAYFVVGLQDRVFVGALPSENTTARGLFELQAPPSNNPKNDSSKIPSSDSAPAAPPVVGDGDDVVPGQIQAVAGHFVVQEMKDAPDVFLAVARYDKSLVIYRIEALFQKIQESSKDTPAVLVAPMTIHKTSKRASSLCFAEVPSGPVAGGDAAAAKSMTVVVAGDLAGDAFAFSLTSAGDDHHSRRTDLDESASGDDQGRQGEQEGTTTSHQGKRLLLGHTASMLTAVEMSPDQSIILTADRDEKIRVSSFPRTTEIRGFLLGHEAFVSGMAVMNDRRLLSCGGDRFLRLWDYDTYQELASFNLASEDKLPSAAGVPSKLSLSKKNGSAPFDLAAVMYEDSLYLDVFRVEEEAANLADHLPIQHTQRIELPCQPLALSMIDHSHVLVLMREPEYAQIYQLDAEADQGTSLKISCREIRASIEALNRIAKESSIEMPLSVLEKDTSGNLKLQKMNETRNASATVMPWNNAERKELARERNRRSTRKRRRTDRGTASEQGALVKDAVASCKMEGNETR